jgi:hypothetical protein
VVQLATDVEAAAGTDALKSLTPSSLRGGLNATGSAPVFACRAWVNFDGTGTVAIRASGNVSSITDNGTGDYTVNFTTAMPDANYSAVIATGQIGNASGSDIGNAAQHAPATNFLRIGTRNSSNGALLDCTYISVAIFR